MRSKKIIAEWNPKVRSLRRIIFTVLFLICASPVFSQWYVWYNIRPGMMDLLVQMAEQQRILYGLPDTKLSPERLQYDMNNVNAYCKALNAYIPKINSVQIPADSSGDSLRADIENVYNDVTGWYNLYKDAAVWNVKRYKEYSAKMKKQISETLFKKILEIAAGLVIDTYAPWLKTFSK